MATRGLPQNIRAFSCGADLKGSRGGKFSRTPSETSICLKMHAQSAAAASDVNKRQEGKGGVVPWGLGRD